MSDHRWQGYSHRELFAQINAGPGAAASHGPARRWSELTRALGEVDSGLAAALAGALGGWEGEAADKTRDGIRPLGDWAVQAQEAAEQMRQRAEEQAEFVSKARADMPPPVAITTEDPGTGMSFLTHLFGGQTDYEVQEAQQNAAEQRAFAVMQTYDSSTSANMTSLASFTSPPQVVVDAPPPSSSGGGSHHAPVTITWGATPASGGPGPGSGGARGAGSAAGRSPAGRSSRAPASRSDAGARASGSAASSGTGRGPSRRSREDTEPVDRAVTEEFGQDGGFFDEQQTLSRPVIGGGAD